MLQGRAREMGLGSASLFTLAEARERAAGFRRMLADGIDPIEARKTEKARKAGWRNAKHAAQWTATLDTYASTVFGKLPVADVDTTLVLKVLEPIWASETETATRVRGRIESVLDWARTRGYREGENPARWKGHLSNLLAKRSKVAKVQHHAALPFAEAPAFAKALTEQPGVAAKALAFTILTAARTGETIGATWAEIDLSAKAWTIPATRMKAGAEHRVPGRATSLRSLLLPLRQQRILRLLPQAID